MAKDQGKKVGRNKNAMAAYKGANRREHNKVRRLIAHLKRGPHTQQNASAWAALERYTAKIGGVSQKMLGVNHWIANRAQLQSKARIICAERRDEREAAHKDSIT